MSMHEALFGDYPIPEETYQVAHHAFPKGNLFTQIRDQFGMLYHNHQFAHLFAVEGQPALAPARLARVTVMQYIQGLGDRHAADNVRDRISWKYALGLPLDDPGFDFSVLCEFRAWLLATTSGQDGYRLLEACLDSFAPLVVRTEPAIEILRRVRVCGINGANTMS